MFGPPAIRTVSSAPGWVFHKWSYPVGQHLLTASPPSSYPPSTGPSPSDAPFEQRRRRSTRPRSETFCSDLVHEYFAPIRLLAPHRSELRSRLYLHLPRDGSRSMLAFAVGPHFRSRVPQYLDPTCRLDDTRPPWVTNVSSPPCRPHTPWCDEEEPKRLHPRSAGSTIPRLWPTGSSSGWLPSITTRWCSSSPSDSTSRWTPCPPVVLSTGCELSASLGCVRRFQLRARLGLCLSTSPGP